VLVVPVFVVVPVPVVALEVEVADVVVGMKVGKDPLKLTVVEVWPVVDDDVLVLVVPEFVVLPVEEVALEVEVAEVVIGR
jgi:hypothetical protein